VKRFQKILVIIDQNERKQPGLARALQMQHAAETEITLFTNVYDSSIESSFILDPHNLDAVKRSLIDYQTKKLTQLSINNEVANVTFEQKVVWQESAYISDLTMVDDYQPDLVIKSCRPDNSLNLWLFNSSCSQLLKACPCPILFVKNEFLNTNGTVIAAVDPGHKLSQTSQLDSNVLHAGLTMSSSLHIPLHACHCFDPSYWDVFLQAVKSADIWTDVFPANPDADNQHVLTELKEHHYQMFTDTCTELVPHAENRHFINGSVEDEIPELASKLRASVVVLGTTYRTGLLGSSAEKILENVEIDLLVVKPFGFESPLLLNETPTA